jgi:hypothetical protein
MENTPIRYQARRSRHKQGIMEWQGERIKVDEGIQPLLLIFNRFDGIATVSSCLGGGENTNPDGMIAFTGESPADVKNLHDRLKGELTVKVRVDVRATFENVLTGYLYWHPEDFDALVEQIEMMQVKIAATD